MIGRLGKSVSTLVATAAITSSLAIAPAFAKTANESQRTLNIYNWSDYTN
ncbi:hypothetical protein [Endozoicomonas atrinae]|nr:hypothetical protein [Endozoicomonas atrinae]